MMAGDGGTSNHDPYATDKSHWVQTGPHVMMVGTAAREMASIYPRTMDPDPSQAYVMFQARRTSTWCSRCIQNRMPRNSA
jgi:hypothetical protein